MQKSILTSFILLFSVILLLGTLNSCARRGPMGNTDTLAGLQAMANPKYYRAQSRRRTGRIREMALKEIALSLGAQAGLASRAKRIDEELTKHARQLDIIYDFNTLVLEHNILPPVLLEGRNTLNLPDAQTIRISDRTYKVAKQARFVTTPPTWRQYLWMDYVKPDMPHTALLPKTKAEKSVWCTYVEQGWNKGIEQADIILEESVARVKEDFIGMVLYRKLLAMNMISPPYISHTELGVTGDGAEMRIDDRVLRITALPALNVNAQEWKAAVAKDENALEQFKHMENIANRSRINITSKAWQPMIAPVNVTEPTADP
jgi:defect-in-organelle-trafficking protein DotC